MSVIKTGQKVDQCNNQCIWITVCKLKEDGHKRLSKGYTNNNRREIFSDETVGPHKKTVLKYLRQSPLGSSPFLSGDEGLEKPPTKT